LIELAKTETPGVIDSNVHIGKSVYGTDQSAKQYLGLMGRFGIEKAVISCFTPPDLDFEKANAVIEKLIIANPAKFAGAVRVDPRLKTSLQILKKFSKKQSFVCLSLNPYEQSFKVNSPQVSPIYEFAEKCGFPVVIESGYPIVSQPTQLAETASEFRNVKFIMTHAGQLLASGQSEGDAILAINENPNLYCDTSQIILSGIGGFIEELVHSNNHDSSSRIIFGSNSPAGDLSVELMRVGMANIEEKEKRQILSENARKLFNL
jgi:predicted TIM-barrel fold metal-dependent hydrolase